MPHQLVIPVEDENNSRPNPDMAEFATERMIAGRRIEQRPGKLKKVPAASWIVEAMAQNSLTAWLQPLDIKFQSSDAPVFWDAGLEVLDHSRHYGTLSLLELAVGAVVNHGGKQEM